MKNLERNREKGAQGLPHKAITHVVLHFLPPYCRAFCIKCSTVYRCISPHQAVLETVVKMSEAFRKTQPKGIWLYAGTTHWLFSMQNKMQRKPIWDALATFLLTTQMYGLISNRLSYSITEWMYVSIHHNVRREIVQISAEKKTLSYHYHFSFYRHERSSIQEPIAVK